jgi:hypothetical protein
MPCFPRDLIFLVGLLCGFFHVVAVSCWLLGSCCLLSFLSVAGCWLLAAGCWLLAAASLLPSSALCQGIYFNITLQINI